MLTPIEALSTISCFEGAQQRYRESVGKLNQINVAHLSPELQAERQGLIEGGQEVPSILEHANVIVASYRMAQDKSLSDQQAETLRTATDALNTYIINVDRVVRASNPYPATTAAYTMANAPFAPPVSVHHQPVMSPYAGYAPPAQALYYQQGAQPVAYYGHNPANYAPPPYGSVPCTPAGPQINLSPVHHLIQGQHPAINMHSGAKLKLMQLQEQEKQAQVAREKAFTEAGNQLLSQAHALTSAKTNLVKQYEAAVQSIELSGASLLRDWAYGILLLINNTKQKSHKASLNATYSNIPKSTEEIDKMGYQELRCMVEHYREDDESLNATVESIDVGLEELDRAYPSVVESKKKVVF